MPYRKDRIKKLIGFTPDEWEIICKKAKSARLRTGTYTQKDIEDMQEKFKCFRTVMQNYLFEI